MATTMRIPSLFLHQLLPRTRTLSTSTPLKHLVLPPRAPLNEADITESFLKGSGPGGQKINKTSSAVQLRHIPSGLVVKCQETRSRDQNRKLARQALVDRLEMREKGDESRVAKKAEVKQRKKASRDKKTRRKYRKLEEGNQTGGKQEPP